jgi:hypothetical protein
MKLLKDKIVILILLTILGLVYLMTTRGHWETYLEQDWAIEKNRVDFSDNISIESEHLISSDNLTVGTSTYLFVKNKCIQIDTVSITMLAVTDDQEKTLRNKKRRVADMDKLVFDSQYSLSDESFLKSIKMKLCPGQRIEIANWYDTDAGTKDFIIEYVIKEAAGEPLTKRVNLEKETEFKLSGRHHYDFIVLLYPVLWIALGLLVIVKIIKVSRKK